MRTSVVFAVGILGLVLSQGQLQAQPGTKGAVELNAKVTSVNPLIDLLRSPRPSVEHFTAYLHGDEIHRMP